MAQHNFKDSKKESDIISQKHEMWNEIYSLYFPTFKYRQVVTDEQIDKSGIDAKISLGTDCPNILTIKDSQEKYRKTKYSDILIEHTSVQEYGTKGWIYKTHADIFVYNILPSQECYIIPMEALSKMWIDNEKRLIKQYKSIKAYNDKYTTVSTAIPVDDLFKLLKCPKQEHYVKYNYNTRGLLS